MLGAAGIPYDMIELTLFDKSGDARRRILLDASQIESVKEESDEASFGLRGATTAAITYLELRMRSGAVHHVADTFDSLKSRLGKREP